MVRFLVARYGAHCYYLSMRLVKAKDLKQKMVIVNRGLVFLVFKVNSDDLIGCVEVEINEGATGLLILQQNEYVLVLGEV